MYSIPYLSLSLLLLLLGFISLVALGVQRLHFHPLKNIPGPKLAAATGLYELYYDCILHGQFHFKIEEMHKRYGESVTPSVKDVNADNSRTDRTNQSQRGPHR